MIVLLAALLAQAHDPEDCPPLAMIRTLARDGAVSPKMRACLDAVDATQRSEARWVTWRAAVAQGASAPLLAEADAWLVDADDPDLALEMAEVLAPVDKPHARRAADRAAALGARWELLSVRVDRLDRLGRVLSVIEPDGAVAWSQGLAALHLEGPRRDAARSACAAVASATTCEQRVALAVAKPGPPTADDLIACSNVGYLLARAAFGGVYTTERDCALRAALALPPGPGRQAVARLAARLALGHEDREVGGVALAMLREAMPDDPLLPRD